MGHLRGGGIGEAALKERREIHMDVWGGAFHTKGRASPKAGQRQLPDLVTTVGGQEAEQVIARCCLLLDPISPPFVPRIYCGLSFSTGEVLPLGAPCSLGLLENKAHVLFQQVLTKHLSCRAGIRLDLGKHWRK